MLINPRVLSVYRLVFGVLGLSAVATEIVTLVGRGTFVPANFFSFFTVESNIFAAIVLLVGGVCAGKWVKHWDMIRGAAALYMVTTGIVFAVLLSGLESSVLTAVPWDNTVLHYMIPLAVFVDWLLDPPKKRISFKKALVWLVYPVVYLVYSLVRGSVVGWYPYPFLDPAKSSYPRVLTVSLGVAAIVVVLTWLLIRWGGGASKRSGAK